MVGPDEQYRSVFSSQMARTRSRPYGFIITTLILIAITVGYTLGLTSVYNRLNDRITSLTTAEVGIQNEEAKEEQNITIQLNNMTDVSDQIIELRTQINVQTNEIDRLKDVIDYQLNTTVHNLNLTVMEVQESVQQKVQEVNENVSSQNSLMAYQFAGTFAILGSLISFWHMMNHIRKLNEPMIQRKIIAIMWMIPIYSISAWFGLIFVHAQTYLSLIKDFYEAYIIYTFLSFLIAVLARGNRNAVIDLLAQHADHLKPPIRFKFWAKKQPFASPRHKAEAVLDQCQIFTMQFVLVRPVTSIILIICDAIHESSWDYRYPQFYIMWIVNISIFFALTGLVRFYHVVKNDLNWMNPFAKFLCIKGVVFLTFWQGVVISFVANAVFNEGVDNFNAAEWSKQAQSFLICLEMFFFAITHCFVFPTDEWEPGYREKTKRRIKAKFGDNLAIRDFVKDVKLVMSKKKSNQGAQLENVSEGTNKSLMKSDSDEEEIDINWRAGWSRIEQYIDLVEAAEEELKLTEETETETEAKIPSNFTGDHDII